MNVQEIIIFGGKGTAINIAEQIENARTSHGYPMRVIGFAIDDPSLGKKIAGFPVLTGVLKAWEKYQNSDVKFIFSLFRPDVMADRLILLEKLGIPKDRFANFIHPLAYISNTINMGYGNVVLAHASIQNHAKLGNFNIVNSNVVVEHDAILHDGVFLAASSCIGARVEIGKGVFVGLSATIREDVKISDNAFIGMGSCVLQSVADGMTVYGVPARVKP